MIIPTKAQGNIYQKYHQMHFQIGTIFGVCARGGFELSFTWENSALTAVEVLSKRGGKCTLVYKDKRVEFDTDIGEIY